MTMVTRHRLRALPHEATSPARCGMAQRLQLLRQIFTCAQPNPGSRFLRIVLLPLLSRTLRTARRGRRHQPGYGHRPGTCDFDRALPCIDISMRMGSIDMGSPFFFTHFRNGSQQSLARAGDFHVLNNGQGYGLVWSSPPNPAILWMSALLRRKYSNNQTLVAKHAD